ncbi:MAG TPA: CAP domain-containing protein [Leptolyngbyaceae cyanobacterium]
MPKSACDKAASSSKGGEGAILGGSPFPYPSQSFGGRDTRTDRAYPYRASRVQANKVQLGTVRAIRAAQALAVLLLAGCTAIEQLPSKLPAVLSTGGSSAPAPTVNAATAQSEATGQMEAQVFAQINTIRQQQGLSELRQNDKLAQVARDYSRRMAEGDFFAHTSPQGDTMVERVHAAGIFYFMLGENLFTSTNIPQPANAAVNGWMNSPGHRENILRREYRETGIGVWRQGNTYYFTQLFMRSL